MKKYSTLRREREDAIADNVFATIVCIVFFVSILLIGYSVADNYYGEEIYAQMSVINKERIFKNTETNDYVYSADLLEDNVIHYDVPFSYRDWKQIKVNHIYNMNCKIGYFSGKIISCWP